MYTNKLQKLLLVVDRVGEVFIALGVVVLEGREWVVS